MHMTAQEAFRSLADCMTLESNTLFFSRLVVRLADTLGVDHVLAARILPDKQHARTLAVWSRGQQRDDFTYPLAGTPCEQVLDNSVCFFPEKVSQRFPHDAILIQLKAEAYLGMPITAPDGHPLGLLAILHDTPLPDFGFADEIIRIAAARTGAELIRQDMAQALEESQQRLQNLISHLPGMVYRCHNDRNWTMEFLSDGVMELTGYPAEDFIDNRRRSFADLIHEDEQERLFDEVQTSIARRSSFNVTYRITTATGETRWLCERGKAIFDEQRGEPVLEGFICDISKEVLSEQQRERHERKLIATNRALNLLSHCNEMLVHAEDEDELLQDICQLAVDIGGYRMAWVGFAMDDAQRTIKPQASAGVVDGFLDEICLSWSSDLPNGCGPSGIAVRSGLPQIIVDLACDPNHTPCHDAALSRGHRSVICLPLKNSQRTFGVLLLYQGTTSPITDDERRLLCDLADDLAFGIATLRARQRQQRIQHAVMQIATAVTSRSSDAFFLQLAQHMASALGAGASFVVRLSSSTPPMADTLAAVVDGQRVENAQYDLSHTPCERVLREGEFLLNDCSIDDISATARDALPWVKAYAGRRLDNTSGKPIGLLSILFREPIEDPEFVTSILRIFAAGAAAELERQRDEMHIRRLAYTDIPTDLPNRTAFRERLDDILHQAPNRLSLLFLDLNRFKEINDIHGHDVGDQILADVAKRFQQALEAGEFLARLGGDEFVVILEEVGTLEAIQCTRRLQETLDTPFLAKEQTFHLEVSIGIACYPDHASSASELLQHADIAMYQAKHRTCRYCLYQPAMGQDMASRLDMAKRLSQAIDDDRLELYYQAQVEIASGRLIGAEALCRWHDDELGWVSPGDFIPLAEERGMIGRLGHWVIEAACRQLAAWRDQGLPLPGQLAINVASQQLDDRRLMQTLEQILRRHRIASSQLCLEITESSFMNDPEQAIAMADALKVQGFGLAIDDFGTGYSSLAHLKRFAADKIKIDISFIRDMLTDTNDHTIVKTIIAMAQNLGLETIAEGIELQAQGEALRRLGCEQAQGFLYSRPQSATHFTDHWLR
ncbi:hypothetical protein GCM10007160_20130 [Litchfieldella qijiaojingensis]|uniref:EAL domain-containing protein n=2 Tax=Litchfieldella qijiaojingensis TaxID=980347 RepID=A0ABQ2YU95_9GAMM|nr:hypothetical protein GCM10007160_20130 [Halomonas qijiaojingensis]